VTSPPAVTDERALAPVVDDPRAGDLLATVGELETLARFDRGGAEERAEQAVAAARELGLPELEQLRS
jgi:two-component system cell cycle response regulator